EVGLDRDPDPSPEAFAIALDRAHGLVEEDPLDPEEGDEHRREPEGLVHPARRLRHPVVEAREINAAEHHPRHPKVVEHPPELLGRVDQVDDDDGPRPNHSPCSPGSPDCDSSRSTPPALIGWTNCTRAPPAPRVGSGRRSWTPAARRCASSAASSSLARQTWWMP